MKKSRTESSKAVTKGLAKDFIEIFEKAKKIDITERQTTLKPYLDQYLAGKIEFGFLGLLCMMMLGSESRKYLQTNIPLERREAELNNVRLSLKDNERDRETFRSIEKILFATAV